MLMNLLEERIIISVYLLPLRVRNGASNKFEKIKGELWGNHMDKNHFHKLQACINFPMPISLTIGLNHLIIAF